MPAEPRNWFDRDGEAYARHRPDYPDELAGCLARLAPDTRLALDVGCGNGQLTCQLAGHFAAVVGVDASSAQLDHAVRHPRVEYRVAPAEQLGVADRSVGLITAAQAAHWFDLPRFYAEARRVAVPAATIALVSYGVPELDPEVNQRFLAFYRDEIGPYWPAERRLVDSGYADLAFPFAELPAPRLHIRRAWDAHAFLAYVATWSATRRAREAGKDGLLVAFSHDLLGLWGQRERTIVWPIHMRLGAIS